MQIIIVYIIVPSIIGTYQLLGKGVPLYTDRDVQIHEIAIQTVKMIFANKNKCQVHLFGFLILVSLFAIIFKYFI
jgi:hypothetical protein